MATKTPMAKPFDFNNLSERLKARGLDVAEEAAGIIYEETRDWTKESVALTDGKLDDLAIPALDAIDGFVKTQIDKIDGEVG